jgi:hypothetical protein
VYEKKMNVAAVQPRLRWGATSVIKNKKYVCMMLHPVDLNGPKGDSTIRRITMQKEFALCGANAMIKPGFDPETFSVLD